MLLGRWKNEMKKRFLFRKGGLFNPICKSKDWREFAFSNKDCKMYIYDDGKIAEFLDVFQKMKENNIEMVIVNGRKIR